jgi:hypothetical protein
MSLYFPNLKFSTEGRSGVSLYVWEGTLQPIQSDERLPELLDDIHEGRPVEVCAGAVRHHRNCRGPHKRNEWFAAMRDLFVVYKMRIEY